MLKNAHLLCSLQRILGAPVNGISHSSTCICLPAEASAQAGAFLSILKKPLF